MRKSIKLINQQGNHNKYYEMNDNGNSTWTATYGRIGRSSVSHIYNMSEWAKKYSEKLLRKGYTDISASSVNIGLAVRVSKNLTAIVMRKQQKGMSRAVVMYENEEMESVEIDSLSPAYINPDLKLHQIMYPNLCAKYAELNQLDNNNELEKEKQIGEH